jgi:hypothetical protein
LSLPTGQIEIKLGLDMEESSRGAAILLAMLSTVTSPESWGLTQLQHFFIKQTHGVFFVMRGL